MNTEELLEKLLTICPSSVPVLMPVASDLWDTRHIATTSNDLLIQSETTLSRCCHFRAPSVCQCEARYVPKRSTRYVK